MLFVTVTLMNAVGAIEVGGAVKGAIREAELERENELLVGELQVILEQTKQREVELERELNLRTQELKDVMDHFIGQKSQS